MHNGNLVPTIKQSARPVRIRRFIQKNPYSPMLYYQ
jgi:hypothetical protein